MKGRNATKKEKKVKSDVLLQFHRWLWRNRLSRVTDRCHPAGDSAFRGAGRGRKPQTAHVCPPALPIGPALSNPRNPARREPGFPPRGKVLGRVPPPCYSDSDS